MEKSSATYRSVEQRIISFFSSERKVSRRDFVRQRKRTSNSFSMTVKRIRLLKASEASLEIPEQGTFSPRIDCSLDRMKFHRSPICNANGSRLIPPILSFSNSIGGEQLSACSKKFYQVIHVSGNVVVESDEIRKIFYNFYVTRYESFRISHTIRWRVLRGRKFRRSARGIFAIAKRNCVSAEVTVEAA